MQRVRRFRFRYLHLSPYLIHGIEECGAAQSGGLGIIVYNRKEGRALGEVTKFLVYNARKRQTGAMPHRRISSAPNVAGVQDARFQQLMPDDPLARFEALIGS
jgi:GTP cyclohydrolase II